MNKIFRFFLAAALALSLFAPASASSSAGDDVIRGPYEPTRFGDNTFIDVQGGVNAFGASNMTRGDVWSSVRPSAALGVSLGKWFVPSVGLRVGWQGLMSNWAPGTDFSPALPQMRGWYNYAHADLLVDCCNWFGGYRRERIWSVAPYLSVGAAWNYIVPVDGHDYNYAFITDETPVRTAYSGICSVAFGAGLYNRFRISDRVGITLDVRAVAHDRDLLGAAVNYGIDASGSPVREAYKARGMEIFGGNLSAMVGLCISLGPVGWKHRGTPDDAISSDGNFAAVPVPSAESVQPTPVQNTTPPAAAAADEYAGRAAGEESLRTLQRANAAAVAYCNSNYPAASRAYGEALQDFDTTGAYVIAEHFNAPSLDKARAWSRLAGDEPRPDFTAMSDVETARWSAAHSDVVPTSWERKSARQKNAWLSDNVYGSAARIYARRDSALAVLQIVRDSLGRAKSACAQTVAAARRYLAEAGVLVDSAGNVLPACYPGVAPEVADAYCALANSPVRVDFTAMPRKDARDWTKTHGDILPDGWRKMTPEERNGWLSATVYVPADRARKDRSAAEEILARAVETLEALDRAIADGTYRRPASGGREPSEGEEDLAFAFFSVAWDTMNPAQILEFEQEIAGLDKSADYDVVGYADITTGSMSINNRLRRGRAATVVALLRERGFTGRLTPKISGGSETMFEIAWKNCAAVIRPVAKDTVKLAEEVRPEPLPSEGGTGELFGWQIMSGKARIPSNDRCFLGYEPTVVEEDGGILKYIIGVSASPSGAYENKVDIKGKYPDAFLVRISNGVSPYCYKP